MKLTECLEKHVRTSGSIENFKMNIPAIVTDIESIIEHSIEDFKIRCLNEIDEFRNIKYPEKINSIKSSILGMPLIRDGEEVVDKETKVIKKTS